MQILGTVEKLYKQGFAVREIAEELGISTDRIYRLMKRHNLRRRNVAEASRLAYLRKEPSFKPMFIENHEQEILKISGAMLYWAEGTKTGNTVDFTNSDDRMICIFLRFLRNICRIDEDKLRVYLYCYPQHDADFLINYWAELTGIPKNKFLKPKALCSQRRDRKNRAEDEARLGSLEISRQEIADVNIEMGG